MAKLRYTSPGGCGGTAVHATIPSLAGSAVSINGRVVVVEEVDELVVDAVAVVVVDEVVVSVVLVVVEEEVDVVVELVVELVVKLVTAIPYLSLSPLESPNTNEESSGVLTPLLISS